MFLAAGPFGLGPMELVLILLVLVMLFGATRLADLGGSLGKGIREFRKNVQEDPSDEAEVAQNLGQTGTTAAGSAETVSAIKCPSCGTLNASGSRHCSQCGAALTAPVS